MCSASGLKPQTTSCTCRERPGRLLVAYQPLSAQFPGGNLAVYVSRRRRPGMGSACTFHTRRRTPSPRCTDAVAGKKEDLDRLERPDIEIASIVKAKRLRFGRKPRLEVSFEGEPRIDKVSGTVRENLPSEVEPGVTYRDVRVRWRAAAKLDLEDRDAR
jgi:hypothetical protein